MGKNGKIVIVCIVAIVLVVGLIVYRPSGDSNNTDSTLNETINEETPTMAPDQIDNTSSSDVSSTDTDSAVDTSSSSSKKNDSSLSKKAYKKKCKRMYHDDLFFTDKDLEGKLIKAKVFVGDRYVLTANQSMSTYELIDKYRLRTAFYEAHIERKGKKSYASAGSVNLFFSDKYKLKPSSFKEGTERFIYGEIISFGDSWNGYNSVGILVKYVEKR